MHLPVSLRRPDPGTDPLLGDRTERQTPREERFNVITHFAAMCLSVAGLGILVARAVRFGTALHVTAAAVYGTSMVVLFLCSSLYHGSIDPRSKPRLQVLDHAAVFLLIAGSYTPFTLVTLHGAWGWSLFGVAWFLALVGALSQGRLAGRHRAWGVLHYLATSWVIVVAAPVLLARLPMAALAWLLAGGLAYSFGTLFYLATRVRYSHVVWHLFVVAGAACHWVAVAWYVMPGT